MKPGIHPNYRTVVFHDTTADAYFLIRSTIDANDSIEWKDGNTYPLVRLDVSSASHPFYTGQQRAINSEGRAARFQRRFGDIKALR